MNILLDTCVVSELVSPKPNQRVLNWVDEQPEQNYFLSVVTIGEIQKGIVKLADDHRRSRLVRWLEEEILVRFAGRILPLDTHVMLQWGELKGVNEKAERALPMLDSLIAATAIQQRLALATRNEKDFAGLDLKIVNPWVG